MRGRLRTRNDRRWRRDILVDQRPLGRVLGWRTGQLVQLQHANFLLLDGLWGNIRTQGRAGFIAATGEEHRNKDHGQGHQNYGTDDALFTHFTGNVRRFRVADAVITER